MSVNWGTFKTLVVEKLQFRGESYSDLSSLGFPSNFNTRALIYLYTFVRDSYSIYYDRAALTVNTSDVSLDLLTTADCAKPIYRPRKIWINNTLIEMQSMGDFEAGYSSAALASGVPTKWMPFEDGIVRFDKACASGYSNSYASGFGDHLTIDDDADVVTIPDRYLDLAVEAVAAPFALPVVSDEIGISILEKYSAGSAAALRRWAAENVRRFTGSVQVQSLVQ